MGGRVEREYLVHTRVPHELPQNREETSLTYDEVFAFLEPHATLHYTEGELSVKVLHERFRGTVYEPIFQAVPKGKSLAVEDLYQQVNNLYEQHEPDNIEVAEGHLWRHKDNNYWQSEQYHMDWHGRATVYRLAVVQLVPAWLATELDNEDLDMLSVSFTPAMTNTRQFEVRQGRIDMKYDPHDPAAMRNLMVEVDQLQVFEYDDQQTWKERASLVFCEVTEMSPYFDERNLGFSSTPTRAVRVLLDRPALPSEHFDLEKTIFGDDADPTWWNVLAPLPQDLQPPKLEDMIKLS